MDVSRGPPGGVVLLGATEVLRTFVRAIGRRGPLACSAFEGGSKIDFVGMAFGRGNTAGRWFAEQGGWWESHFDDAVNQLTAFVEGDGLSLVGRRVLDVGCGDGIISLGIASRVGVREVTGLDLEPTDLDFLSNMAGQHGIPWPCSNLSFEVSTNDTFPVPDRSIDLVVCWSVLEHVSNIPSLLAEIGRVLKSEGLLFCQVWPMFHSEHGSHLWNWVEPFGHLVRQDDELRSIVGQRAGGLSKVMLDLYDSCSRVTLDQVGSHLNDAGFFIAKVQLLTDPIHVPPELQRTPLSLLGISGFKLLAVNQARD